MTGLWVTSQINNAPMNRTESKEHQIESNWAFPESPSSSFYSIWCSDHLHFIVWGQQCTYDPSSTTDNNVPQLTLTLTTFTSVPYYIVWWQSHNGVNNFHKAVGLFCHAELNTSHLSTVAPWNKNSRWNVLSHYRSTSKVAAVVESAGFLLHVELNPVVKAGNVIFTSFSNEHVFKAARVCATVFNIY